MEYGENERWDPKWDPIYRRQVRQQLRDHINATRSEFTAVGILIKAPFGTHAGFGQLPSVTMEN